MGEECKGNWQGPLAWNISQRGYHLSRIDVSSASLEIFGIFLHFKPDVAGSGPTITSIEYGDFDFFGTTKVQYAITKRVKSVKMIGEKG